MATEVFANQPSTTVSSGGTDAPSPGTVETLTVASSSSFQAASSSASPPTQFHVADQAPGKTGELITVTNTSGTTWTVTRGAEGTTPVTHAAGFTVQQVTTAGWLGSVATGKGSGVTVLVPAPTGATATDTPNVVAAVSSLATALASSPATLLFQDGTYQLDSNSAVIRSAANFAVRGNGATVLQQAPNRSGLVNNVTGNLFTIADSTDFSVEGITFDGLRDTVAPITPVTAAVTSGQSSVTVASGNGARYLAGQYLVLLGGLGTAEQNQAEGFGVGYGTPLVVSSVTAGGGSGGGDLVAFTTTFANSYSHVSGTLVNDDTGGPYACTGAYLTPYQCGSGNSVAGRTLRGEDQQNGLHLISCQRFTVSRSAGRNLWESPFKCGTGFASTSLTDGCSYGTILACQARHCYDQGVSLWISNHVTVTGCELDATGWTGISCSLSNDCVVTGNHVSGIAYAAPGDTSSGHGLAVEGGLRNILSGNRVTSPAAVGIYLRVAPPVFAVGASNSPTLSAFLEASTAAGTSIQLSATANLVTGGLYCILDGPRTEPVTVSSIADGTHVQFAETIRFSHASGCYVTTRVAIDNEVADNTVIGAGGTGINPLAGARNVIRGNTVTGYGAVASGSPGIDMRSTSTLLPAALGGDGSQVADNTVGSGSGVPLYLTSVANVRATGNRLGSPLAGSSYPAMIVQACADFEVRGNWLAECLDGPGLEVQLASVRGIIAGNTVRRCHGQGMLVQNGCDSLTITGNQCGSNGDGIYLLGLTSSQVSGNICNGNASHGIYLGNYSSTGCSGVTVSGNTARDDGSGASVTTGGSQTQQYGILEAGNSNNNVFTGNEADGNGTAQLTIAGGGTASYANIVSGVLQGGASVMAPGSWLPADSSYAAVTYDPATGGSGRAPAGGEVYLCALYVRAQTAVSKIRMVITGVTGASLTASANYCGLYNSAGSLIGLSADQSASGAWGYTSSGSIRELDMTLTAQGSFSLTLAPGLYYGAFIMNGTTLAQVASGANSNATWLNGNSAAATLRYASSVSGSTTVASGSNGGEASAVASWSSPSAGVLDVASVSGFPTSGTVYVAASGPTTAVVTYTGTATGQLTGCAYAGGSATGTVATGGAVALAYTSLPSTLTLSASVAAQTAWWMGLS